MLGISLDDILWVAPPQLLLPELTTVPALKVDFTTCRLRYQADSSHKSPCWQLASYLFLYVHTQAKRIRYSCGFRRLLDLHLPQRAVFVSS